jgi:SH3-like domain-containing protein
MKMKLVKYILLPLSSLISLPSFALCVNESKANLHATPNGAISWTVGKYTPLIEETRQGNWVKVRDQDGEAHWISAPLVTNKIQCLSVKVGRTILRTGPSGNEPPHELRYADRYTAFKNVEFSGDWYQVEDVYGEKFWVHKNNIWRPVTISNINL